MTDFIDLGEFDDESIDSVYSTSDDENSQDENQQNVKDLSEALSASLVGKLLSAAGQRKGADSDSSKKESLGQVIGTVLSPETTKIQSKSKRISSVDSLLARSDVHKTRQEVEEEKLFKKRQNVEKTKRAGPGWFNMESAELTEEVKHDLKLLKMRQFLDTKRFYKRENMKDAIPKVFQIGTVVSGAQEFYSNRVTKKEQSKTFVDELLKDRETKLSLKRKASDIRGRSQGKTKKFRMPKNKKKAAYASGKRRKPRSMFSLPAV